MKAILRSINNFSCKLKQSNNQKYNISPKIRSNKFKNISGNGNVTIEDALNKNLKDYKIYGNTYQNSTSGNQLIDFSKYTSKSNVITVFSFENDILTQGQTQSGTFARTVYDILDLIKSNPQKKLKISYKSMDVTNFNSTSSTIIQLIIDRSGTRTYHSLLSTNGSSSSYSIPSNTEEITYASILIYTNNSSTAVTNSSFTITEPLLYFDDNSEYESYTNGPAPNPDYPQEIISCGDRTKNLCGELEQGSYNDTNGAKTTSTTNYRNKEPIKVLPNTNYIFSINGVGQAINVLEYNADGTYIGRIGTGAISSNNYFTTSNETAYINIFRGTSAGIEKWQIEQNDIVTSYEPYGYKIPVNVRSDNLFDMEYINAYIGGSNGKTFETLNNTAKTAVLKCKPNTTYTIKKFETTDRFLISDFPRLAVRNDVLNPLNQNNTISECVVTTNSDAQYLYVYVSTGSEAKTPLMTVVEGSTVPDKYIPYYNETTNIYLDEPLRKIDGYIDYVDFKNGKVVRRIKEVLLSSENNWASATNTRPVFSLSTFTDKLDGRDNFICSHFKYLGNAQQTDLGFAMSFNSGQYYRYLYIQVPSSIAGVAEVSNFKTWFGTIEPVTLDYPLATPTEESITLPNINLIEGKNIISIGTEVQGVFEAEYYSKEIIDISDYKYNLRKVED